MIRGFKPASTVDGRFVLLEEASRGGMGTVWKARDQSDQQSLVALKLLHDSSPEQCQRFVRERQLLADLTHPNIVSYVAHGVLADDVPYLVMEWLDGENLAERLSRAPLTLQETMSVLRAALSGLAFAHRRGIVHRDLKPSNLFLRAGRVDSAVLLDLGLARYVQSGSALTRTGSVLGTPSYMAPEQAQGERAVTSAADVFSLGCVLFECLTGAPPFTGEQLVTVLAKVLFQPTPRLSELRPELPASLDALLARMLDKDPARRVSDADALLRELDALGPLPSLLAPNSARRSGDTEQELVGVILASDGLTSVSEPRWPAPAPAPASASATLPGSEPPSVWPELSSYGGEPKRMADGTTVVVLAQRGGAATDLSARTARCALHMRSIRPELSYTFATGRGVAREHDYVGDAIERAGIMLRELHDQPAGTIWLDATTSGLLDPRFQRRRVEHGIVVYALEREEHSVDPARPLLGRPTPCVGRERELAVLALSLQACVDDATPQANLVIGPAGIGKSRLRHELVRRAEQDHAATVLLALGDPMRSTVSCGLIGQAIARLCGLREGMTLANRHALIAERIGKQLAGGDRELTCAFIAELCGLPELPGARIELRAARQSPTLMLERLTQSWLAFVRAETASKPLLIVLDDLQWSDLHTLALVDATLRLSDVRLMVLALGRPETVELHPALWAPRLTTLPLLPLSAAATRRLVHDMLGDRISSERVERIIEQAGGNALYIEELIRAAEAGSDATPATVLAMLQARIGLLPAAARRVLRVASVFGERFPIAGVAALLAEVNADEELTGLLSLLAKHELLEPLPADRSGQQLRFRHALLRDAAYALLTQEDALRAHERAARYLEQVAEDPAVIGAHCERGGAASRAVQHYTRAVDQASQRNDVRTTLALIQRCVSLGARGAELGMLRSIESLTRFYQHDFAGAWEAASAALALLPIGHAQRLHAVASTTYVALQMGRMAEVAPLIDEMLTGEPDDSERERLELVRAFGYASIAYVTQADRARAQRLLTRMNDISRSRGEAAAGPAIDVITHGELSYWQVRFAVLLGDDPVGTLQIALAGAPALERIGDLRLACAMWAEIGECRRRVYSLQASVPELRHAVALARGFGEPVSTAFVSTYLANALAAIGTVEALEEASALAREVLELTGEGSAYRALGHVSCALAHLHGGDIPAALEHAHTAHRSVKALGMRAYYPHFEHVLIRTLLAANELQAAVEIADAALLNADGFGPLGLLEPALRVTAAQARFAVGRHAEARGEAQCVRRMLTTRLAPLRDDERARAYREVPELAELLALEAQLARVAASDVQC